MLTSSTDLRAFITLQHQLGKKVGLVPTMGALHEGHLSLVESSVKQCDVTVVSIFVNPSQFGPNEDFQCYPRTLENDLSLLQKIGYLQTRYVPGENKNTVVEVFAPSVTEMYPKGFDTSIHVGGVSQILEGKSRPLHFQGVATVVLKLFLASQADTAFFGQKDFQQICVVRKMVSDLSVAVEIVMCPIVREQDGLAMSSRNRYLSASERQQAVVLSQSLQLAEMMIVQDNVRDAAAVKKAAEDKIRTAPDAVIDYVAIADPITLGELQRIESTAVILLGVKIGTTRLIDNLVLSL